MEFFYYNAFISYSSAGVLALALSLKFNLKPHHKTELAKMKENRERDREECE
jgi:hypothetical protein